MKRLGTVRIETERLVLRPFRMEDARAMYENWANDSRVTRFLTWVPHENVEVSRQVLAEWTSQYGKPDYYNWAIAWKNREDQEIGNICIDGG